MKAYTTKRGDWWDMIAKKVYGNEYRADWLMTHNPEHLHFAAFPAGVVLRCPDIPSDKGNLPPWRG